MSRETWYVMQDGSPGDPRDIAPGPDGILRHRDGRVVAYAPHGPRTRGVDDPDAERAKAAAEVARKEAEARAATAPKVTSEMVAEPEPAPVKRPYKTRAAKGV